MNGDTDVLNEEILSCNNDRELDGKLDSNLNPRNVSHNPPINNIKYINLMKIVKLTILIASQ